MTFCMISSLRIVSLHPGVRCEGNTEIKIRILLYNSLI